MSEFQKELAALINKHSVENESDTPDFILAEYLNTCLDAFGAAMDARDQWYKNGIPMKTLDYKIQKVETEG
jgi:hypothetical protein